MQIAPIPVNEIERLQILRNMNILDSPEEQVYDDLTLLAANICDTPIALISLLDEKRQWFKSHKGLDVTETPRDFAVCAHAILGEGLFEVPDLDEDERFFDNPLVIGSPFLKFYAGIPLIVEGNLHVGTLCVLDYEPKKLNAKQSNMLQALANQVSMQLELRMKRQACEKLSKTKDDFITMINHELRTPLTAIKGALSLMDKNAMKLTSDEKSNLTHIAHRNTDRLLNIVNDIIDITKLSAEKTKLNWEVTSLAYIANLAADLNDTLCKDYGSQLVCELPDNHLQSLVEGDEHWLLQVATSLISNAAKFTYPGDTIILTVAHDVNSVYLTVKDHGPGIVEEMVPIIFDRFEQINNAIHKPPGTGLGLSICKKVVELHQGRIEVESEPGNQTIFRVVLPRVHPNVA